MPQPLENWAERVCAGEALAVARAITAIALTPFAGAPLCPPAPRTVRAPSWWVNE